MENTKERRVTYHGFMTEDWNPYQEDSLEVTVSSLKLDSTVIIILAGGIYKQGGQRKAEVWYICKSLRILVYVECRRVPCLRKCSTHTQPLRMGI